MNKVIGVVVSSLLGCALAFGQSQHTVEVCGLDPDGTVNCHLADSSVMGGVRFEDYKITNPAAVQFDPAQRLKELAALGASITNTLCAAPQKVFTIPAPTITFDKNSVQARIYYVTPTASFTPSEFMDVQFSNFTASNGYTSPTFGFRMDRLENADGSEAPQYKFDIAVGNPGLENVPGLPAGAASNVDPVNKTASAIASALDSDLVRQAILGVFVNAQSILNAAKFTVTNPAPSGKTLWSSAEIISLAGQAQPWILAGATGTVPLGPP
jgi:hypothetical protein